MAGELLELTYAPLRPVLSVFLGGEQQVELIERIRVGIDTFSACLVMADPQLSGSTHEGYDRRDR